MAVAVKNAPEVRSAGPLTRAPVVGLVGTLYAIAALAVVFELIPWLWQAAGFGTSFVSYALLGLVMLAAAAGLAVLGGVWLSRQPVKGARAAIFVGFVGFLAILCFTCWTLSAYDNYLHGQSEGGFGFWSYLLFLAAITLALLFWGVPWYFRPSTDKALASFEAQGWFSATSYKPLQGQRVRRGTIVGILLLVGSGIYTLIVGGQLTRMPENLALNIPFTGVVQVDLSPKPDAQGADAADKGRAKKGDAGDAADELRSDKYPKIKQKVEVDGKEKVREVVLVDRYQFKLLSDRLDPKQFTRLNLPGHTRPDEPGPYVKEEEVKDPSTGEVTQEAVWYVDQEVAPLGKIKDQIEERVLRETSQITPSSFGLQAVQDWVVEEVKRLKAEEVRQSAKKDLQDPVPPRGEVVFATIPLLPAVKYTLPLLLIALALWGAWRIVNLPTFADFLIATEAELNKVSWITRKRLIQDTIVVLVTVVLMAFFLFFMDQIWRVLLTFLRVLQFGEDAGGGTSGGSPLW